MELMMAGEILWISFQNGVFYGFRRRIRVYAVFYSVQLSVSMMVMMAIIRRPICYLLNMLIYI